MSSKEQVKILLAKENITLKTLSELLGKKMGKHYPIQTLSGKLS